MDLEALIKNLKALDKSLKSTKIRESKNFDDFEKSVKRFQATLADLIVVYETSGERLSDQALKPVLVKLQAILKEIDDFSTYDIKVLDFLDSIVPLK